MRSILSAILLFASVAAYAQAEGEWQTFKPAGGRCSVVMPGIPDKQEKKVDGLPGEIAISIFMLQPDEHVEDENLLYGLSYIEYPAKYITSDSSAKQIKAFLDNARNGSLSSIKGKLLSETDIKYKKYPGREQRIEVKEGVAIIKFRHYLISNRLYSLQVISYKDKTANKSVGHFLDSFVYPVE